MIIFGIANFGLVELYWIRNKKKKIEKIISLIIKESYEINQ